MIEKNIRIKNQSSFDRIDHLFLPIINTVKDSVPLLLGQNLEEIRLLGSIPRGEAVPYVSDIDFLLITRVPPSDERIGDIEELSKTLHEKYPFVWSVDLTIRDRESLSRSPDYELILSTDSICLHGKDSYSKHSVDILNRELNELWGLAPYHFEAKYKETIRNAKTEIELKQISRWIGKDMLKCFRRKIIADHGILDRHLESIYERLKDLYPENNVIFDDLFNLYSSPVSDRLRLERVFETSLAVYKEMVWDYGKL